MNGAPGRFDPRVAAVLLVLNLLAHFVPFERPGFQPDDFGWLEFARGGEPWSFVETATSQGVRPLGLMLFMMEPYVLGLHEGTQLAILVGTTSLLTLMSYAYLTGILPSHLAALASLAFVLWPVKHEIYASQLFGVNSLAGILVVASGLLFSRWIRAGGFLALAAALTAYGLSLFIYEIGYLAPILFYVVARREGPRARSAALFLIPAALYWVFRWTHPHVVITTGRFDISIAALGVGLPSLPSNLIGFQVARNLAYGLFAVWKAPAWFQFLCASTSVGVGLLAGRWFKAGDGEPSGRRDWAFVAGVGLLSAFALAAPAAMVLVESRHSILASVGMGVAVAAIATRLPRILGQAVFVILLLTSQGLALRQAEVSQLQASVHQALTRQRDDMRAAKIVVIDIASLADRVPYTWGETTRNVLRAYWGLHAFASGGLDAMVADVLHPDPRASQPRVTVCAAGLVISDEAVRCERHYVTGRPFTIRRPGTLVIDFKTLPLPPSVTTTLGHDYAPVPPTISQPPQYVIAEGSRKKPSALPSGAGGAHGT